MGVMNINEEREEKEEVEKKRLPKEIQIYRGLILGTLVVILIFISVFFGIQYPTVFDNIENTDYNIIISVNTVFLFVIFGLMSISLVYGRFLMKKTTKSEIGVKNENK